MSKEYTLTEEHRAQLKPWADKWIANAMSTDPMDSVDRDVMVATLKGQYEAANLPWHGRVVFVPSPFVAIFAAGFAACGWYLRKTFGDATRQAVNQAVNQATDQAVYQAVYQATEQAVNQATRQAVYQATEQATEQAVNQATRQAADQAVYQAVNQAARQATEQATEQATRQATEQAAEQAVYQAVNQAARQATEQATEQAVNQATEQAVNQATRQAVYQATRQATEQATEQAVNQATRQAVYQAVNQATEQATEQAADQAADQAVNQAADQAVYQATRQAVNQAARQATEQATEQAVNQATRQAVYQATRQAVNQAVYQATRQATRQATDLSTWAVVDCDWTALAARLKVGKLGLRCAHAAWYMWRGGNQWSGWAAYISFFRHVANLGESHGIDYSKWDHYEKGSIHAGPQYLHSEFCVVSDRPVILKVDEQNRPHCIDGPFCQWSDGSALFSVHGVRVPAWIILKPEDITVSKIEAEANAEIRRVMVEKYGLDRFIKEAGAEQIHQDKAGTLYRKRMSGDEDLVMVHVINSTEEPDGSRKEFFLRVALDLRPLPDGAWPREKQEAWMREQRPQEMTAHNAVASTFGLRGEEYAPLIES